MADNIISINLANILLQDLKTAFLDLMNKFRAVSILSFRSHLATGDGHSIMYNVMTVRGGGRGVKAFANDINAG